MRRIAALAIVAIVQAGDVGPPTAQTDQELRSVIGGEGEAQGIIHQAIEAFFIVSLTPADTPRSVKVLAAQLPSAWLPQVHGVTFDRLDDQRVARDWANGCLRLMTLAAELSRGVLTIAVSEGNKCERRRSVLEFTRSERGWQRGWGIRPTVEGGLAHCPCK